MADTRQEKRKPGGRYQGMGHEKRGGDHQRIGSWTPDSRKGS